MKHVILWALCGVALTIAGTRAARDHGRKQLAQAALVTVRQQAEEVVRWRASAQDTAPPPRDGLAGTISQELSRAGLNTSAMQSLSPEAQTSDHGLIRQHATLTLVGLTLPQLGKFLGTWRTNQPWVVSGIDLSPTGSASPGADLPLRAVLTLDGVFQDRPRTPSGASR